MWPFLPALLAVAIAPGLVALWWRRRARHDAPTTALRSLAFVAIDTETTGLDPRRDALVALAGIPFQDGQPRPADGYARLVNPGRPIPDAARAIHGIADADVKDAALPAEALPPFLALCAGHAIVAHTAPFDLAVINRAARAAGLDPLVGPVLDIGALAHAVLPSWWDLSLEGLARLVEMEPIARHTAEGDALTAGMIFVKLIPLLERRGAGTLRAAIALQHRAPIISAGPGATGGGLAGP